MNKKIFYEIISCIWILISPITLGISIPFIYHYIIMNRNNNIAYLDTIVVYFIYIILWSWVNEKINNITKN